MASSSHGKGKAPAPRSAQTPTQIGNTPPSGSNSGVPSDITPSMVSKVVSSALGLGRDLLGTSPTSSALAGTLASNQDKSQLGSSASTGESSTWAESSLSNGESSSLTNSARAPIRLPFRTDSQLAQASETEFASFLESQPVQDLEPPVIDGERLGRGWKEPSQLATSAADILIKNDIHPASLTTAQFRWFQRQSKQDQLRAIVDHVKGRPVAWQSDLQDFEDEYETSGIFNPLVRQAQQRRNEVLYAQFQAELEPANRARDLLISNHIDPTLLTDAQFFAFKHASLNRQIQMIQSYLDGDDDIKNSNGWARRSGETNSSQAREGHPVSSAPSNSNWQYRQQALPNGQPENISAEILNGLTGNGQGAGNAETVRIQRAQAEELLVANGINPTQLTPLQLDTFQVQRRDVQQKSIDVYRANFAQMNFAQDQRRTLSTYQQPDGAAVVELLSRRDLTDLLDTSQNDESLPFIWELDLSQSQHENIDRLADALAIPSPFDLVVPYDSDIRSWLRKWDTVLKYYTDDVWGDFLPLVQEAKEEVEEVRDSYNQDDKAQKIQAKAVRRLALIVEQLKGH